MSCMLLWKRVNLFHFQIISHSLRERETEKEGWEGEVHLEVERTLGKNKEVRGYTSLKCYFGLIVILAD